MRTYDNRWLVRASTAAQGNRRIPYAAFSGKYPIRIYIRLMFYASKQGRWITRFSYNGRYSLSAIRQGFRERNRLVVEVGLEGVSLRVIEYHRNGVIYEGDGTSGLSFYGHNHVHFQSGNIPTRNSTAVVWSGLKDPEIPIRCDSFVMLVPKSQIPKKDDVNGWRILYKQMRARRYRNMVN
jgi:hypothetical protein